MPTVFDGLIDIQHVPDSSLIIQALTSGGMALTNASSSKPCCSYPLGRAICACRGNNHL